MIILWLLYHVILGAWASKVWERKGGSPTAGFFMGALLGIVGLIIAHVGTPSAAAVPPPSPSGGPVHNQVRQCPACKEAMKRDASICPHCRVPSTPWMFNDGFWWATDADGELVYLDESSHEWQHLPSSPTTSSGGGTTAGGRPAPAP